MLKAQPTESRPSRGICFPLHPCAAPACGSFIPWDAARIPGQCVGLWLHLNSSTQAVPPFIAGLLALSLRPPSVLLQIVFGSSKARLQLCIEVKVSGPGGAASNLLSLLPSQAPSPHHLSHKGRWNGTLDVTERSLSVVVSATAHEGCERVQGACSSCALVNMQPIVTQKELCCHGNDTDGLVVVHPGTLSLSSPELHKVGANTVPIPQMKTLRLKEIRNSPWLT